jgi:hypothetical protein
MFHKYKYKLILINYSYNNYIIEWYKFNEHQ